MSDDGFVSKVSQFRDSSDSRCQVNNVPDRDATVEQWFTFWLAEMLPKEVPQRLLPSYRNVVHTHIIPALGPIRLVDLTHDHARILANRLEGRSPKYKANVLKVFALALSLPSTALREAR